MARLSTVSESSLEQPLADTAEPFRSNGKLADVYLQIANSQSAMHAYLQMENALKSSTLSTREIEAIKLLVSEQNRCDFCLSVHHVKAGVAGFTEQQRMSIRSGDAIGDRRIDLMTSVVRNWFVAPGPVDDDTFAGLKETGFTDAELVDLALVAATIFFTNIFNHLNATPVAGKPAPILNASDP